MVLLQTPTDETVFQILRQLVLKHRDFSIDIVCPYADGKERFTEIMIYNNEKQIANIVYESKSGRVKGLRCSSYKDKVPENIVDLMLEFLIHQFEEEKEISLTSSS
ncbi:MAG: hypothetical protein NZM38_02250 [Cytophagales bacterium]|nr:hypothetical protein [Cytophagales bacterium]MDW8383574.1 hypothetical protein [Flammeovirgaceae bacterium]